jgi:23S rRNA (guanine1835-N2)-methyltransferase
MVPVAVPEHGLTVVGAPGVFSADRLDLGARLLAAQIAERAESLGVVRTVVDLGCGNGVLGLVALRHFPEATVHFLDDSRCAVECARSNVMRNMAADAERASFTAADVFGDDWTEPIDVVLCNPPFHHTKAMSDEVAWQMIVQSHRHLAPGGELWIVGNRHLGYHAKLSRVFGNVRQLDAHPKFVVLGATR